MKANDTPRLRNVIWKMGGGSFFVAFTWGWGTTIAYLALYILRRF
jgi:hypothetical protein